MDLSPGAITPKFLSELLDARLIIADLTGRNPNVFYELGIAHSFARPLILIADSPKSLPFDTKDERIIELGEYATSGLTYSQGETAKVYLQQSLKIVLAEDYSPPTPLRDVAANASVDQLAPENPIAAEMAQIRETLEEIRKNVMPRPAIVPRSVRRDITALRDVVRQNIAVLDETDFEIFAKGGVSPDLASWVEELRTEWLSTNSGAAVPAGEDPWESTSRTPYSDEPPF